MSATTTTRIPWLALLPLLAALVLAAPSGAAEQHGTFRARITVTSQCNTQQALFGPQAQRDVTVICEPGFTPYQKQSIDLGGDDDTAKETPGAAAPESAGQAAGAASFNPSIKKELSPPLPSAATFASKLIFVIF